MEIRNVVNAAMTVTYCTCYAIHALRCQKMPPIAMQGVYRCTFREKTILENPNPKMKLFRR